VYVGSRQGKDRQITHPYLVMSLLQHLGKQHKVVILDPHHLLRVLPVDVKDGLGKLHVGRLVHLPLLKQRLRLTELAVHVERHIVEQLP
jgi:hypothetical protein